MPEPVVFPEHIAVALAEQCPRWETCSVPICPLDLSMEHRHKAPGDPSCPMRKSIRLRIGAQPVVYQGEEYYLPHRGMTGREWEGFQKWAKKSPEEREAVKARLKATQFEPATPLNEDLNPAVRPNPSPEGKGTTPG